MSFAADFLLDTTRAAYLPGAQWHSAQVPQHPFHPWPRRRVRPVRLASHGRRDYYPNIDAGGRAAIERMKVLPLFPRFGTAPRPVTVGASGRVKGVIRRQALRLTVKAVTAKAG
jgi:hypothetical protein